MRDMSRPAQPQVMWRAGARAAPVSAWVNKLRRNGRVVYAGVPLASALGAGGASALACRRRTGFDTLATVVAATTLLMAGVSVYKLLPRRRPSALLIGLPMPAAPERRAPRQPDAHTMVAGQAKAL
ncbi:hypothetical protein [Streptomyces collinus]|uniref:hypothetical protein n=1 Tax=Streptomyces collinus TaxID=42684 RepID=UPI003332406A